MGVTVLIHLKDLKRGSLPLAFDYAKYRFADALFGCVIVLLMTLGLLSALIILSEIGCQLFVSHYSSALLAAYRKISAEQVFDVLRFLSPGISMLTVLTLGYFTLQGFAPKHQLPTRWTAALPHDLPDCARVNIELTSGQVLWNVDPSMLLHHYGDVKSWMVKQFYR